MCRLCSQYFPAQFQPSTSLSNGQGCNCKGATARGHLIGVGHRPGSTKAVHTRANSLLLLWSVDTEDTDTVLSTAVVSLRTFYNQGRDICTVVWLIVMVRVKHMLQSFEKQGMRGAAFQRS